jgi:hypothetical protein
MSHYAVVISAVEGKGGTWSGAIENLKNGWVPMYVREAEAIPDGNRALIRRGIPGLILDSFNGEQRLMSVFNAKKDERGFSSSKSETNELPYETKTLETGRGSSIESEVHETEIIDDCLANGPRNIFKSFPNCSLISFTTRSLAVAVVASTGMPAGRFSIIPTIRR